jgi:hypothetical protein
VGHADNKTVKVRAWLNPVVSEESLAIHIPRQLLEAWRATVQEWDWKGPATRDRNVGVIQRHYHVDQEVAAGLPPGLALDWCRAGRPDPSAWIEEKLDAILSEERHRSVA